MNLLDGKKLSQETESELATRVANLKKNNGDNAPILATILVGADPASATYVRMKQNACQRIGMKSIAVELPSETTTRDLLKKISPTSGSRACR